jgi:acetate kinase
MRLLVVNAGSSSLKLSVLDGDEVQDTTTIEDWDGEDLEPLRAFVAAGAAIDAVGHRIVHGGELTTATLVTPEVERTIESLVPLARIHQTRALAAVRLVQQLVPGVPAVACFDTTFHAMLPLAASTYALPADIRALGVRRYGFHGLSHEWASRRAAELLGRPIEELAIVTAHLGSGASLCAVFGGRSVDTTMGFTPLDGIVMATRPGSLDPGIILWLEEQGFDAASIEEALEHRSGLFGLSGVSDLRVVLEHVDDGDDTAQLAYQVYLHRLRAGIAGMVAALGRLDALVFTGGVGEHLGRVRADAVAGLGFLGLALDDAANQSVSDDGAIGLDSAPAATLVVRAREDVQIAREVRAVLTTG